MKFAVLGEQVLAAQIFRLNVPNAHTGKSTTTWETSKEAENPAGGDGFLGSVGGQSNQMEGIESIRVLVFVPAV